MARRTCFSMDPSTSIFPSPCSTGQQDADVPVEISLEIAQQVHSQDVVIELVKAADHRFSGPGELTRLAAAVDTMTENLS